MSLRALRWQAPRSTASAPRLAIVAALISGAGCVEPPTLPDFDAPCGVAISMPCPETDPRSPDVGVQPADTESGPGPIDDAMADIRPPSVDLGGSIDARLDVGEPDAEPVDVGELDAELLDAERLDAELLDAEPLDAKPLDAKPLDAEPLDAEPLDAEPLDAELLDAELLDAERLDAEPADAEVDGVVDAQEAVPPPPVLVEVEPPGQAPLGGVVTLHVDGLTGAVARYAAAFVWSGGELPLEHAPDSRLEAIRLSLSEPGPDTAFDVLPVDGVIVLVGPHHVLEVDYRISADIRPVIVSVTDADSGGPVVRRGQLVDVVIEPYVRPESIEMALLRFDGEPLPFMDAPEVASDAAAGVLTFLVPALMWPGGAPPRITGRVVFNFGPRFEEARSNVEVTQ